MDYSKLTEIKNKYKLTIPELALILGYTKSGLIKKINNDTIFVKDIEKLAAHFNLPMDYFFSTNKLSAKDEGVKYNTCKDCIEHKAIIQELRTEIKEQKEEIALLNRELGRSQPGERAKVG